MPSTYSITRKSSLVESRLRLLLDEPLDLADAGVVELGGDLVLRLGLVEEPLVLGRLLLDVLEGPDLLGLGVLHEVDDRRRALADEATGRGTPR